MEDEARSLRHFGHGFLLDQKCRLQSVLGSKCPVNVFAFILLTTVVMDYAA